MMLKRRQVSPPPDESIAAKNFASAKRRSFEGYYWRREFTIFVISLFILIDGITISAIITL